jgi:hypothetical protein
VVCHDKDYNVIIIWQVSRVRAVPRETRPPKPEDP